MRFKTLPIFTLATYRMGLNFSIRVTPNINSITVGLFETRKDRSITYVTSAIHPRTPQRFVK